MKKKLGAFILTSLMIISSITSTYAAENISVYIDNIPVSFDVQPKIINNSTFVPMRKIFEELGANIEWDNENKKIIATKDLKTISLYIDKNFIYVNGQKIETSLSPKIVENRTLVPLRLVSELFDCNVDWDSNNKKINIYKNSENKANESNIDEIEQTDKPNTDALSPEKSIGINKLFIDANWIDGISYTLHIGEVENLNCKITPHSKNLSISDLYLSSSDESIVKVYPNGEVEGISTGEATITGQLGNKFSNVVIDVVDLDTYSKLKNAQDESQRLAKELKELEEKKNAELKELEQKRREELEDLEWQLNHINNSSNTKNNSSSGNSYNSQINSYYIKQISDTNTELQKALRDRSHAYIDETTGKEITTYDRNYVNHLQDKLEGYYSKLGDTQ